MHWGKEVIMNELNIFGKFVLWEMGVSKLDRKIRREILGWRKFIKNKCGENGIYKICNHDEGSIWAESRELVGQLTWYNTTPIKDNIVVVGHVENKYNIPGKRHGGLSINYPKDLPHQVYVWFFEYIQIEMYLVTSDKCRVFNEMDE